MIFSWRAYLYDGLGLMLKLSWKRMWNYAGILVSYRLSLAGKTPYVWSGPFSLSFETSSACNLKCPECAAGSGKTIRNSKFMPLPILKSKLALHQKHAFYCNLYFQGEPFLHPEIFDAINYAREKKYYTVISTNGHFLDEENCIKTIDSGLNRLIVSLDGIEEEAYLAYRRGGQYEKVLAGIRCLADQKRKQQVQHPLLVVQFLVNKTNEHQLTRASAFIKSLGADVSVFKTMQVYSEQGRTKFLPSNPQYNRYAKEDQEKGRKSGCFRLWSHMVYTSDGVVVPCCYDKTPDYGTIEEDGEALDTWKGAQLQAFRSQLLCGNPLPDICDNCEP